MSHPHVPWQEMRKRRVDRIEGPDEALRQLIVKRYNRIWWRLYRAFHSEGWRKLS